MARQEVNIGVEGNDGTGDSIRESFKKTNENFQELYAVFGLGGQINFTNLSDTPNNYSGAAGNVIAVKQDELGVEALQLASNGALTGNSIDDTIGFDYSVPGKLVVFSTFSSVQSDTSPQLGGPLDANNFGIGKVAVSEAAALALSAKFSETFTVEDLVINKRFAEENYLKRGAPGATANVRDEPNNATGYTFTINSYATTRVVINNHGLDSSSNGAAYLYSSTGTAATGLTNNTVYYIRVIDSNNLSFHTSSVNALSNSNPITILGGTGTQTIRDNAYNPQLEGFWLENEALPRKSVVRRQGDTMTGALYLHDHPGELAGQGTPNSITDLQAATKYYVDNAGFTSNINLYVNLQGDDAQRYSPPGKEGRSLNYAFRTINKACEKAEEIQLASPFEAGPYMQTITYDTGANSSVITSSGLKNIVAGRLPVRVLIEANKEFIQAEVIAYINETYPLLEYSEELCSRDIGYILDSIVLDTLSGNNANYLSRWAGIRYYSSPSAKKAITTQYVETIAGIDYAKTITNLILQNIAVPPKQLSVTQTIDLGQNVDSTGLSSVAAKFEVIKNVINNGVLNAPTIIDGFVYEINITNGGFGNVDQGDPTNTDLLPGKIVIGKTSGAKGIIVAYNYESDSNTVTPVGNDTLELQLVEPIEFVAGEELEFGNTVRENQITILVESGIYLEDYPIRVPNNVSIKGDEFRRTIIRPKNRLSQSRWANVYFYRDKEFDGLTGDSSSASGFPDTNLPVTGTAFVNPLTSFLEGSPQIDGYFGYHYLLDPTVPVNVSSNGLTIYNQNLYVNAPILLKLNKNFIVEEAAEYLNNTYPLLAYNEAQFRQSVGALIESIVFDLINSGREKTLETQSLFYTNTLPGQETEITAAVNYIKTIAASVLANSVFGAKLGLVNQVIDLTYTAEADSTLALNSLVNLAAYALNVNYNPARNNRELDAFMVNDATRLSNITVQGHGGFMVVLDPEGQILTKSPYVQVGSSFSQSINRQAFRGGMLIDAYTGNVPMVVTGKDNPFTLIVESNPGEGLFYRKPQTPAPFYLDGVRFQVNAVREWDPVNGTAKLILDRSSNNGVGFTGVTSTLLNLNLDVLFPVGHPNAFNIVVQTAGYRSMLGNDFTQVNDLGYGLVVTNGALSEMVSMFTYYTWSSFYAKNGGEIRSLNGSNAYGEYGLVSEGADPNEIPDAVTLRDNMVVPVKTFIAPVTLVFGNCDTILLNAGDILTSDDSTASGTVIFDISGGPGARVYLKNVTGTFDTAQSVFVTAGTGTILGVAPDFDVPTSVVTGAISNLQEQLSVYVYDAAHPLQNRGEVEIYHSGSNLIGRYEVSNVSKLTDYIVGGIFGVDSTVYSYSGGGSGAEFTVGTTRNGYKVYGIVSGGTGYSVGEVITVPGEEVGGISPTNNLVIDVAAVTTSGVITSVTVGGFPAAPNNDTPYFDGQVYRLNFTTSGSNFSNDGLITALEENVNAMFRHNGSFVFNSVGDKNRLVTRPSTAIQFIESQETTYRSISFSSSELSGAELPSDEILAGLDINYDYIRLIVKATGTTNTDSTYTNGGTTCGATVGDRAIAIDPLTDAEDIARLENGDMLFGWDGKVFVITDYIQASVDYNEDFDIIQFSDLANSDINYPATASGLSLPVVLGSNTITLRVGLASGEPATITINISTCRATGHDFLDIGTGGFNTTNYPNVLLGLPRDPNQANEVDERNKGRVFYVSTDQDGFFRVGRFFTVDQGTGTVTFSASIALSNLDGIGFKRGVVVAEFSTDNGMTNNATDTVPTQSAVRGYVNRRLGFDHNGDVVSSIIGPGVVPLDGSRGMTGTLNMSSNRIGNLAAPASGSDATNKNYVDSVVGNSDTFVGLRDTLVTNVAAGQLLVTTGKKRLIINANTIGGTGVFAAGQNFTASVNGGTGTIVAVIATNDAVLGNINTIVYTDTSAPGNFINTSDTIIVTSGPTGIVIRNPVDEIANGIESVNSDISLTVVRSGSNAELALAYKAGSIVNADVNANAAISQSKLSMNAATTRANSSGISQADLGLASFDSDDFDVTSGWVTIKANGIDLADLPQIATNKALGNVSGSTGNISAIDITTTGGSDSLVRTQNDGSIRINSLRLGGNNSYEILSLSGTTLQIKTPGQATVLTAVGTDNTMSVQIPASVDIGGAGTTQSYYQSNNGTYAGESRLAVDWIYGKVIEANDEKTIASSGIAIGANTGFSNAGQVAVFCRNGTTGTGSPAVFSITGMLPDTDNTYNIGSTTLKYNTVYATVFSGTATQARYADLAEKYLADDSYEPGTVLVFGGDKEVTTTKQKGDTRVAGVVSTNPAYLMNSELNDNTAVAVALQGRVPCKVLGIVKKGDLIVSAAIEGYATVDNNAKVGTVIGKALEDKINPEKGIIEIVVGRV